MPRESIVVLGEPPPPNRSAPQADWMPEWLSLPERITWHLHNSDYANRQWRRDVFERIPSLFSVALAKNFADIWFQCGPRAANLLLLDVKRASEELPHIPLGLACHDDELIRLAKLYAAHCRRFCAFGRDDESRLLNCLWLVQRVGVFPPGVYQPISVQGIIATWMLIISTVQLGP